ncbi:MAG: GAF domain-containing protein [Desulfosarcinaceae bacterium]|nr:GAF domain-containing protein [Desulfosarcinaceae bacterium]
MTDSNNYFKPFCTISRALGTAASQEELLDLVVQSAIDAMGGKAACLFLADERRDVFVPMAQKGLSDNYLHANPMKAQEIVRALVDKGHLVFEDATSDPRLEHHAAKKREGIASLLTVPVVVRERPIGVLSLYTAEHRQFSSEEIEFLCALAEQGGMAIEKSRLLERIEKNALLFLDLASAINSTLDINEVLHNLTVKVSESLGMKGVTIRLLDDESGELKLVASHGLSDTILNVGQHTDTATTAAALKGETVTVADALSDERTRFKAELEQEGVGSMIITPITARDEVIGILRLYSPVKRKYPQDVITLVQALAHQGGLAIQNASMYLKLKEDQKALEADVWSHRSWF